jgi:hypothetical protein
MEIQKLTMEIQKLTFTTLSDIKYLPKGMALYESLKNTVKSKFQLYYLCLDDECFNKIKQLNLDDLIPINVEDFKKEVGSIIDRADTENCKWGDSWAKFCWSLTPFLCQYILSKKVNHCLYLDSDLYFHYSPEEILLFIGNKSCGIHTHKFRSYDEKTNPVGRYNVGMIYFKNDDIGKKISNFWVDMMINMPQQYKGVYDTCADQKILDLFDKHFDKNDISVFNENSGIAYLAPWTAGCYQYDGGHKFGCNGSVEKNIFTHFSHFTYDIQNNSWKSSYNGEWKPEDFHSEVKKYYENYFEEIKKVTEKYNL